MGNPVEKLTHKIAWHEAEARRLRSALEVFRELEGDSAGEKAPANLAGGTFMDAVKVILAGGTQKTTGEIRSALLAGNFTTKGSTDFRVLVANRLADAAKRGFLRKHGEGKGVTWSLPV